MFVRSLCVCVCVLRDCVIWDEDPLRVIKKKKGEP